MNTTNTSLLIRVKDRSDAGAWNEFYGLYAPLLYRYARGRGLSRTDSQEVRDQAMAVVYKHIGKFEYDRQKGGFKNWLRRIAESRIVDSFRKRRERQLKSGALRDLRDQAPSPDELWEEEWKYQHLKYCVNEVRELVSESSYEVFHLLVFEERTVAEVCRRLEINRNQVYKAKSRVLQRVRERLSEFDLKYGSDRP